MKRRPSDYILAKNRRKGRKSRPYRRKLLRKRLAPRLPISGFPKSKMVKLRYSAEVILNPPAVGVPTVHYFTANSMYDPDLTGVGHQPRGFDEWMNVYDHYTVLGCRATARWIPSASTDKVPSAWGIALTDDASFPHASLGDVIESVEGGKNYRLAGQSATTTGGIHPTVTRRFSAKKFFGVKAIVGQDEYKGTATANPTEMAHLALWACGPTVSDPDAIVFQMTIDYIAVLTERKGLARS